jgi:hypothetical protein
MWLEVYTVVCSFSADYSASNELFRFSTTELKWELLNVTRVSGSPPDPIPVDRMVAVGSALYVLMGGVRNELFRFWTEERQWEQLDATRVSAARLVSDPPPQASFTRCVSVGRSLYVFGEERPVYPLVGENNFFHYRFSTTKQQLEWLDEIISGFPPYRREINFHDMVAVDSDHDSDLYVFRNSTDMDWDTGEVGPLLCQIERLGDAPRAEDCCHKQRLTRVCACWTVQGT